VYVYDVGGGGVMVCGGVGLRGVEGTGNGEGGKGREEGGA
jgi:hypothetical protein